jgi:copper chaperone
MPAVLRADGGLTKSGSRRSPSEIHMEQMVIGIQGMSCGGCVDSVRNALTRLPGVQVRHVEVGSAAVVYDPSIAGPESVRRAIVDAGFYIQEA